MVTEVNDIHRNGGVTVIGAGSAGVSAALHLLRRGREVTLVEAERLGGMASRLGCKGDGECVRCDVCQPLDRARQLQGAKVVLKGVSGVREEEGWVATLSDGSELRSPALVIATGMVPYDPSLDPRLGYGRVPGVVSAVEVEAAILAEDGLPFHARKVAFIQCVGSRDLRRGAPYCSKFCCKYAAKLSRYISPADITVFRMDWRPFDDPLSEMEGLVRMVRSRPSHVLRGEGGPTVCYADEEERVIEETFDMVILSVGMRPSVPEGVARDGMGFALPGEGSFPAGCCRAPMDIAESMRDGVAAAERAIAFLEEGV